MPIRKVALRSALPAVLGLLVGIIIGGYLFSRSQPRSFLALNNCQGTCLQANELIGLAASVGINRFAGVLPVVFETDKTLVLKHPRPNARIHYLVIPKKDIKNVGDIAGEDDVFIADSFSVMSYMVRKEGLVNYQVVTNGPSRQGVSYLHFHLLAE